MGCAPPFEAKHSGNNSLTWLYKLGFGLFIIFLLPPGLQMQEDMDVFTMDHKDLPQVDPEEILDEIESDFSQQVTP